MANLYQELLDETKELMQNYIDDLGEIYAKYEGQEPQIEAADWDKLSFGTKFAFREKLNEEKFLSALDVVLGGVDLDERGLDADKLFDNPDFMKAARRAYENMDHSYENEALQDMVLNILDEGNFDCVKTSLSALMESARQEAEKVSDEKTFVIVNAATNIPIHAMGFCTTYSDKEEAEEAAEKWNAKPEWMNAAKVKVVEKDQVRGTDEQER